MKVGMRLLSVALAVGSAVLVGCSSVDPGFLDSEKRLIKDLEPAPYRVAIGPVEGLNTDGSSNEGSLHFSYAERGAFELKLLDALKELNTASEVKLCATIEREPLFEEGYDLIVRPTVRGKPTMGYKGTAGRGAASWALWLCTWIGAHSVEDANYRGEMEVEYEVLNIRGGRPVQSVNPTGKSSDVSLTFWERNNTVSGALFQSMIMPPQYTTDNTDKTSQSLSDRMVALVAAGLTKWLKEDFARSAAAEFGALELTNPPRNGSEVGRSFQFEAELSSTRRIQTVELALNGKTELVNDAPQTGQEQQADRRFVQKVKVAVKDLQPGANYIQVTGDIGGPLLSRSVLVYNGRPSGAK